MARGFRPENRPFPCREDFANLNPLLGLLSGMLFVEGRTKQG
jgi:hypothetical protein